MSNWGLIQFVLRRLAIAVVLLLIISFAVFTLLDLAPGSLEQILLGPTPATPGALAAIRKEYHLNDPFFLQYLIWLKGAVHLDFGRSVVSSGPVISAIGGGLSVSLFLGIYGFAIAILLGVPLGILAGVKTRTAIDRAAVGLSVVGVSAPAYASGIYLLYIFGVWLGWFPVYGAGSGFLDRLWHLTLPAVALALTVMALVLKLTRAAMINALDQDYIVFARARGVPYRRVLVVYGLRNALVPIVTGAGAILGYMLTGAVLVETTFALPGVGALLVSSVTKKDIPVVQGVAVLLAVIIIVVNLLTDIVYVLIDPRIRFSRGRA